MSFFEALVGHLAAAQTAHGLHALARRRRFLLPRLWRPNSEIRVAFSALLRVRRGADFLLIKNLHRPESLCPLGGVFKHYQPSDATLDKFEFRSQAPGDDVDMRNDLRGYLPRKRLGDLVRWYQSSAGQHRETAVECLCREIMEELGEWAISGVPCPPNLRLDLVRSVAEGPRKVPGRPYAQFRIFEVFEVAQHDSPGQEFLSELFAAEHEALVWANDREIAVGRARTKDLIGHHAAYLYSRRAPREETPAPW